MASQPLTWIVTEGIAGTENQCLGVAEALGVKPVVKRINLRQPWKTFSPYFGFETEHTFTGDPLTGPWPDLLIASGRKSIAAVRYIKKQNPQTFCVQIQDPRISPKIFDMVSVPAHDPARADNVFVTTGSPNRITDEKLAAAKEEFKDKFAPLPSPRVAVLIGGKSKSHELDVDHTHDICDQLMGLLKQNYGLMVTTSRRTGADNDRIIRLQLQSDHSFIWDGTAPNPYFGMLAWADFIIVTSDSVSMMSDVATTGKPVYIIPLKGGSPRLDKCLDTFLSKGLARKFTGTLESYSYQPLQDATDIAAEIQRKSGLFEN
jgi:mitochondrial fission protein ELM1